MVVKPKKCEYCSVYYLGIDHETSCILKKRAENPELTKKNKIKTISQSYVKKLCVECGLSFFGHKCTKYCLCCLPIIKIRNQEKNKEKIKEKRRIHKEKTGWKPKTRAEKENILNYNQTHYSNGPKWSNTVRG